MSMLPSLEKSFVKHVESWATEFYDKTIADNYWFFAFALNIDKGQPRSRKTTNLLKKCLKCQLVFVKYYATCKVLSNVTKANFEQTKKFVSQQKYWLEARKVPQFCFLFYLYNGSRIFLFADKITDIDFADIYSATGFYAISILNPLWKKVTRKFTDSFLKKLLYDLEFDQYKVEFDVPEEYGPGSDSKILYIKCRIQGDQTIDKIAKIKKCQDLFHVDVLKSLLA